MKSLIIYAGSFLAICFISFNQSCRQTDHINCFEYADINLAPHDFTTSATRNLSEGDSVYAKKFGFYYIATFKPTYCKRASWNLINTANAFTFVQENIFIRDSIQSVEIFCDQDFNTQYPAGSVLNNLFEIPLIGNNGNAGIYQNDINQAFMLEAIPDQTKMMKFYVKTKTKNNTTFVDSLPTIKIKI